MEPLIMVILGVLISILGSASKVWPPSPGPFLQKKHLEEGVTRSYSIMKTYNQHF